MSLFHSFYCLVCLPPWVASNIFLWTVLSSGKHRLNELRFDQRSLNFLQGISARVSKLIFASPSLSLSLRSSCQQSFLPVRHGLVEVTSPRMDTILQNSLLFSFFFLIAISSAHAVKSRQMWWQMDPATTFLCNVHLTPNCPRCPLLSHENKLCSLTVH